MSEMYKRIEDLCRDRKVTVTQMCRDTGISRSALTELKKGRTKSLSTKVAYKIATYLCSPLEYFLEEIEE